MMALGPLPLLAARAPGPSTRRRLAPGYAWYAGILGVIIYAISSGIPIIIIAAFGVYLQKRMPHLQSFTDYVYKRFGRLVQVYVALLVLFNMGVALTAEYTAMGDLFQYILGTKRWPIVIIVGIIAAVYTAVGGLYVSIITDQWQALLSIVIFGLLLVYVGVTFDAPLDQPLGYLNWENYSGLSSIAVLPISLISSTIYSEAMWQRCWASADNRTLMWGATLGCCAVVVVVFLSGFGGFLAVWGNVWQPAGPDDTGNTILFSLLRHKTWVLVIVSVLSVTMSESAIDSLQNAIVDSITCVFVKPVLPKVNLLIIRILVLVLNVPPMIVSLQGYNILQLFLLANLITTTSTVPVLAGMWQGRWSQKLVTPFSCLSGCAVSFSSLFWWAEVNKKSYEKYGDVIHRIFLVSYDWPPFMLAVGFSVVGMLLGAALEWLFRQIVPGFRNYPIYDIGLVDPIEAEVEGKPGQAFDPTLAVAAPADAARRHRLSARSAGDPSAGRLIEVLGLRPPKTAASLPRQQHTISYLDRTENFNTYKHALAAVRGERGQAEDSAYSF
eukprot:SM000030S11416  [mRNA]  locus=s30:496242:502221:- [translate_table: standard]